MRMEVNQTAQALLTDLRPDLEKFRAEVLDALSKERKELPSKYFYDERGSYLFERICELDDYYVHRVETEILKSSMEEIGKCLGPSILLVEYGCGDCAKTRILLDNLPGLSAYVPIDISWEQLSRVATELDGDYPQIELLPVCADYTDSFGLPHPSRTKKRVVIYYPGSTIGNFDPLPAYHFLKQIGDVCGAGGALLIGVDLKKDPLVLHGAYNDHEGVTAAFNLNILERINRELGADFDIESFRHYAFYNPRMGRVEMHLISLKKQAVHLDDVTFYFHQGESIWTESSYKYTLDQFESLAAATGFRLERTWTDERRWFSVNYLVR